MYTLAFELKIDIDVIRGWSVKKIKDWMAYFRVKGDLESEAYEEAKQRAQQSRQTKDFGEVYDDTVPEGSR